MEQEINVMIFYVSSAVIAGLVSVLVWYLYTHKKNEGISYRAAILAISSFASQRYPNQDAMARFCEDYDISDKPSFLKAVRAEGREILVPQIIGDALNKIGYKVHLVNKVYYLKNPS